MTSNQAAIGPQDRSNDLKIEDQMGTADSTNIPKPSGADDPNVSTKQNIQKDPVRALEGDNEGSTKAEVAGGAQEAEAPNKQKRNRRKQLPMIDFEEQDAYIKKIQQQAHQGNQGEGSPKAKNQKKGQVVGNYVLGRDLGKGTFGEVMVGTHSLTGEKVAIKVLEKEKIIDVHDVERVAREIHILKIVRHPTIVQLYEIIETDKELYLIMEYARGGELFEYIVNRKRVREKDAAKFLHQILSGVQYLHNLGICHRDLKPENLLMDDFNNIKIVDFGLSNTFKPGDKLQTACGSPCYAAPEMVAGQKYDGEAADMWSCGVIIYAMVCGFLPFEDPKTNKLYNKILNAEYSIPDFVSPACQDLIRKILCQNPMDRLSIKEIRNHPWYQQVKVREYQGIYVGKNPIPVDLDIVKQIPPLEQVEEAQASKYVTNNRHNSITTIYYLLLKRHLRKGGDSIADIKKYKPEDFQPGSSVSGNFTALRPDEAKQIQIANKNTKVGHLESSQAPFDQKNKLASQIKLRKEINQVAKNRQEDLLGGSFLREDESGDYGHQDKEQDALGLREQQRDDLIVIQEKNISILQKPKPGAGAQNQANINRGRRNAPSNTAIAQNHLEASVSPSPHRYFQQDSQQKRHAEATGTSNGQPNSNMTTQRLNPKHRNFQIQGQGGGDHTSQDIESIDQSRQAKIGSREQRHGSQPPVSSVIGLTPLRPLNHLNGPSAQQNYGMNQSLNSFKQMQYDNQQMHILINQTNATEQPGHHQNRTQVPAILPNTFHNTQTSRDYEEVADQHMSNSQQYMGISNDYRQHWQGPAVAQRPTKSRQTGRQVKIGQNHQGVTLKNQKAIARRAQESNYHSAMGHYQTSKQSSEVTGGHPLLLPTNILAAAQQQQNTLSHAEQQSPISQGQRMGGMGGGGPVIAASQATQYLHQTSQQADTNRKVRRSMNAVLEKQKFNQQITSQQYTQQKHLLTRQDGMMEVERTPGIGRNTALANANNKKLVNQSVNFVDQQSAGSDFNFDTAITSNDINAMQHTQHVGKIQQKAGIKGRPNNFQLHQIQMANMNNGLQNQQLPTPGIRQKNAVGGGPQPTNQTALFQNRQFNNPKGIRSTRGGVTNIAMDRSQQYQSQEQVATAQQMTTDLLLMAQMNQSSLKKGQPGGYPSAAGNQTEMNFYRGSIGKKIQGQTQISGKQQQHFMGSQKQNQQYSTDGGESVNLPNMTSNSRAVQQDQPRKKNQTSNLPNMVQNNYQNVAIAGVRRGKRGSQETYDRLPTRGGAGVVTGVAGVTHTRFASDAPSMLPADSQKEHLKVGTASSNKESNQALSGTSRISAASQISDIHGNTRMLGSVDFTAHQTSNLNEFQVLHPSNFSKSSKRKNRQITFYPELNPKGMAQTSESKNQTFQQFYPGERHQQPPTATFNRSQQPQGPNMMNRNTKISNKYESMRQKQNQRLLNQSYDFTGTGDLQSAILENKKAQIMQNTETLIRYKNINIQQQPNNKTTHFGHKPQQKNTQIFDDYD